MKSEFDELKNEFNRIKNMGYVKSINNDNSGIGLTFEYLLGKKVEDFPFPDYKGIELKTKLAYSKKPISLFRLTPEGKDFFEIKPRFVETKDIVEVDSYSELQEMDRSYL